MQSIQTLRSKRKRAEPIYYESSDSDNDGRDDSDGLAVEEVPSIKVRHSMMTIDSGFHPTNHDSETKKQQHNRHFHKAPAKEEDIPFRLPPRRNQESDI